MNEREPNQKTKRRMPGAPRELPKAFDEATQPRPDWMLNKALLPKAPPGRKPPEEPYVTTKKGRKP